MKCSYCGGEIVSENAVELNGLYFCNTLHRYSWKAAVNSASPIATNVDVHAHQPPSPTKPGPSALRKTLFGILYTFVFFVLQTVVIGSIVGGIAGVEAGAAGRDASEAGRIAGQQLGAQYGMIIILISIVVAATGSIKGWLPGTRVKKAA